MIGWTFQCSLSFIHLLRFIRVATANALVMLWNVSNKIFRNSFFPMIWHSLGIACYFSDVVLEGGPSPPCNCLDLFVALTRSCQDIFHHFYKGLCIDLCNAFHYRIFDWCCSKVYGLAHTTCNIAKLFTIIIMRKRSAFTLSLLLQHVQLLAHMHGMGRYILCGLPPDT